MSRVSKAVMGDASMGDIGAASAERVHIVEVKLGGIKAVRTPATADVLT
jgi:hypothetical protein